MSWFKVDDQFHSHPKVMQTSLAAIGLWTLAGSYSRCYGLDGFVPAKFITLQDAAQLADELVEAGLWEPAATGFVFKNWDEYQPSEADEERKKAAARERYQRWAAKTKSL